MSDFDPLVSWTRRLSWLFVETPARAAGFLSVIAILVILALKLELGHSWNLYAAGGQVAKAGDDFPLLLQALGSAFDQTGDGELVLLVGGSTVRELTADDSLLSKALTSQCGRDIQFVNLGSSSQTFPESWDIAALAPQNRKRLLLVGINPYRLGFDDSDVISELAHNPSGIPVSYSLLWSVALQAGHVGSPERILTSLARQQSFGARWRLLDLFDPAQPTARQPADDPFQPDRSSYREPVWTRSEKLRQANEYIATRVLDFHERFRVGVHWYNRLFDHFQSTGADVKFVVTPTDVTFGKADRLISADLREAIRLLGGEDRILDLRDQSRDLDSGDFFDIQHLVARGRAKLQPAFVAAVSSALGCGRGVSH
jgi:hypothetical protein